MSDLREARDRFDGYGAQMLFGKGEWLLWLDVIDFILDDLFFTFYHADWRGAWARRGVLGIIAELAACIGQVNTARIWIRRDRAPIQAERTLKRYGIKIGGRMIRGWDASFRVKRRQERWALYLLKRGGFMVTEHPGRIKAEVSPAAFGSMPRAWADVKQADAPVAPRVVQGTVAPGAATTAARPRAE